MKRTKDGSFRVDPTPEIEVFVNVDADIAIEIGNEILVIPKAFARSIAKAIATLDREIRAGEYGDAQEKQTVQIHENPNH